MTHYTKGRYVVTVISHGFNKSKKKETPFIWIQFRPKDGKYERTVELYLTKKTVERVIKRLRLLGWAGEKFAELETHSFEGVETELVCEHEHSDGNDYERWVFPPPAGRTGPISDPSVPKKLDALFGAELRKKGPAAAVATPDVPDVATPDVPDDEIPF